MKITARAQRHHFIEEAGGEHRVEAPGDPLVQPAAVLRLERQQACSGHPAQVPALFRPLGMKAGERQSGDPEHLQRALDPLRVLRRQPRGRRRIDASQRGMHPRPAVHRRFRFQFAPHAGIGGRHRVQAFEQRLEVQHRAADQQGQLAAGVDLGDQRSGIGREFGRAVGPHRIADVDQVVRHAAPLLAAGLGGADVHAAIDQRRIDTDDFGPVLESDRDRRRALARGGGPGQRQQAGGRRGRHRSRVAD